MYKPVYIAIDLHSNRIVIGYMNKEGKYLEQKQFKTSASALIAQVVGIPAETKYLTIEQGNMAHWAASQLGSYVDKLIICDPRPTTGWFPGWTPKMTKWLPAGCVSYCD